MDAFVSVALARKMRGGVVMSSQGWNSIRGSVLRGKSFDDGFAQVDASYGVQGRKAVSNQELERHFLKLDMETLEELEIEHSLTYYIPDPVAQCFSQGHDQHELWGNEVRFVALMYINTGINHNTIDGAFKRASASKLIHDAVLGVQHSLEKYEGELIKVYNDDEELTITCGFGLPPMSHKDDELRSCLCAMDICVQLERLGLSPRVGLSSGYAFCGVIGRPFRKSYHVHGDCAVMCQALSWEAETRKCMILIDDTTYSNVKDVLLMEDVGLFTSSLFGNDIKIRGYRFPAKDKTRHHRRMSHAGGLNVRDNLVAEELMDTQMTRYWDLKAFVRRIECVMFE